MLTPKTKKLLPWIAVFSFATASLFLTSSVFSAPTRQNESQTLFSLGKGLEAFALAKSLVQNHSFANPFKTMPTGPSAHMAPLYPA